MSATIGRGFVIGRCQAQANGSPPVARERRSMMRGSSRRPWACGSWRRVRRVARRGASASTMRSAWRSSARVMWANERKRVMSAGDHPTRRKRSPSLPSSSAAGCSLLCSCELARLPRRAGLDHAWIGAGAPPAGEDAVIDRQLVTAADKARGAGGADLLPFPDVDEREGSGEVDRAAQVARQALGAQLAAEADRRAEERRAADLSHARPSRRGSRARSRRARAARPPRP